MYDGNAFADLWPPSIHIPDQSVLAIGDVSVEPVVGARIRFLLAESRPQSMISIRVSGHLIRHRKQPKSPFLSLEFL